MCISMFKIFTASKRVLTFDVFFIGTYKNQNLIRKYNKILCSDSEKTIAIKKKKLHQHWTTISKQYLKIKKNNTWLVVVNTIIPVIIVFIIKYYHKFWFAYWKICVMSS